MQPAQAIRGTKVVYDLVFLITSLSINHVHSYPLQVLPSIPGYIPVYIRHGDQPLEEINPALAEAFHEGSSLSKSINLDNIPDSPDILQTETKENTYNIYPLHLRNMDHTPDHEENKNPRKEDTTPHVKPSKPNGISNKSHQRSKHRGKLISKTVLKVNPLTGSEKDAAEKTETKLGEETKILENVYDLMASESRSDPSSEEKKEETFDSVEKLDPNEQIRLNPSETSANLNSESSKENSEDLIRKRKPSTNLVSNVKKVSISPEALLKMEKERTESVSLKEKSK